MHLTNIQVAGLKALVAQVAGVEDKREALSPQLKLAFTMGTIYGKAELAGELLQEAAHRNGTVTNMDGSHRPSCICAKCEDFRRLVDCDLTGAARR